MNWVTFLILFPLIPAVLLLFTKGDYKKQTWIVVISSVLIIAASIGLAFAGMATPGAIYLVSSSFVNNLVVAGDVVLALTFLYICRNLPIKKYWIPLLVIVQYGLVLYYDLTDKMPETERCIYVDNLSIIMGLVIAVVGCLIAIYTAGYMKKYHVIHADIPDRSHQFTAAIFLFFFAMFGIVFSNNISWIYFFWEITTLCSFIMIGYSRTEEAINNSFRAVWMLMVGGLAFALGIIYCATYCGTLDMQMLLTMNKGIVMLPVLLLCFAGMNKAAQYPFGNWLIGAMVAPTPSSALLHSSTMVKAGVYLVLRCSPILQDTASGAIVAMIGGASFLAGSALAISQRNGKKILAYSTIANLGLIILCAGIGTSYTLCAALLLIIFHAISKALMFLCVGTIEQVNGSKDVESMYGLISSMPFVTIATLIGLCGMFLAPFGMLISKMAVIQALAVRNPIFPPIVIFGGSMMLFFWTKWMGHLIAVRGTVPPKRDKTIGIEWVALGGLSVLTILACVFFPLIGQYWVVPMYGWCPLFSDSVEVTIAIMLGMMLLPPLCFCIRWKNLVYTEPYLAGVNVENRSQYKGSLGSPIDWSFKNYYIEKYFSEEKLLKATIIGTLILWILMFFMENL
jgi:ech hydrogenase subunit A